jgi:hypothetical protein
MISFSVAKKEYEPHHVAQIYMTIGKNKYRAARHLDKKLELQDVVTRKCMLINRMVLEYNLDQS